MSDKGITLEGLAAAVDALRQELATWKALAHKQDQLSADQITATQSGATAAKISQIAVNTAAIQSLAAQVAGQISLEYVTTLPATGEPLTLYLVPQGDGTAPNFCNEYLWVNNAWELIGTTGAMANNGELSIQVNGVTVGTFTANQAANAAVNITVPTNTNQLVNGAQFVDAAALQAALTLKQNNLNTAQLEAVNSGITAAGVQQIADNATAIAGKQDALTTAQQAAVDSGATAAKIDQISSNAAAIVSLTSSKQDALTTTQLAAVNSGVTAAAVQQIGTNAGNITALGTAVASKAADNAVVHLAGAETIPGDKTWTGLNTYQRRLNFKDAAAVSAGGFGVGLIFYDYEGNRYGYILSHVTSDGTKNIVFTNTAGGYLEFASPLVTHNITPGTDNTYSLGSASYQWASVYAQAYYYKGTAWGLDKLNRWSQRQELRLTELEDYTLPSSDVTTDLLSWWGVTNFRGGFGHQYYTNGDEGWRLLLASRDANNNEHLSAFRFRLNRAGTDSYFYGTGAQNFHLGSSSNKWKTLNGINPGALSLPSHSVYIDISSSITHTDWTVNYYTPTINGYIALNINGCAIIQPYGVFGISAGFYDGTVRINDLRVCLPVIANQRYEIRVLGTVNEARLFACLGNV